MSDGGKGSRPRPFSVSLNTYGKNFDTIFRKPDLRVIEDSIAEDEEFKRIDLIQKINYNSNNKES